MVCGLKRTLVLQKSGFITNFSQNQYVCHQFIGDNHFPQAVYYQLGFERICRKIMEKHHFHYDINAILSDLIYTRILEPCSKRASYRAAMDFLEPPSYNGHDVYRALDVQDEECDLIIMNSPKYAAYQKEIRRRLGAK